MTASCKLAIPLLTLLLLVPIAPASAQSVFAEVPDTPASQQLLARSANLADIKVDKVTRHVSVVRVDGALLRRARGRKVELNLKSGLKLDAWTKSIQELDDGRFVWTGEVRSNRKGGRLKRMPSGMTTIVVNGENATGTIHTHDGRLFRLQSIGGGLNALVEVDIDVEASAGPPDHDTDELSPAARPKNASTTPPMRRATKGPPVIDVIVAYTTTAKTKSGDIDSLIALAIAETNQSFVNSGIRASLRLVHSVEYSYQDVVPSTQPPRPLREMLKEFAGNGDGQMDTIHALRDEYGGDIAILIHAAYGSCGYAHAIGATADTAFAVVCWNKATGQYLFAHEIGHLAGAAHQAPCLVLPAPPFAFTRGFQYLTGARGWSTIMGDGCSDAPASKRRIQYWSDPSRCFEGVRMGVPGRADSVRLWNERAPIMAAFKTPPTARPKPATAAGPVPR